MGGIGLIFLLQGWWKIIRTKKGYKAFVTTDRGTRCICLILFTAGEAGEI